MGWDEEYDVVCVGSGLGGMSAALTAAEHGASAIDLEGRVLDVADRPVPGLCAAGNSAAWLDIGGGYNSGIANTRGLLHGYLAALHMTGTTEGKA